MRRESLKCHGDEGDSFCGLVPTAISLEVRVLGVWSEVGNCGADNANAPVAVAVAAEDVDDDDTCNDNGCSSESRLRILPELALSDDVLI